MSRIAKNSIKLPKDTTCNYNNNVLSVKGKLGEMSLIVNSLFTLELKDEEINILPKKEKDKTNPIWGTTSAHVSNIIKGVSEGFTKTLELNGTGYRASVSGSKLKLQLGFSHDTSYKIPQNVNLTVEKNTVIKISGIDKLKNSSAITSFPFEFLCPSSK